MAIDKLQIFILFILPQNSKKSFKDAHMGSDSDTVTSSPHKSMSEDTFCCTDTQPIPMGMKSKQHTL
jgi:hypothetical protein